MRISAISVSIFIFYQVLFTFSPLAKASPSTRTEFNWVDSELREWHNNTRAYMDRLPSKSTVSDRFASRPRSVIDRDRLFLAKGLLRTNLIAKHGMRHKLTSEFGAHDRPADLINQKLGPDGQWLPILDRLEEMEERKLMSVQGDEPWSDSYWPTYQGVIAARYAARGWPSYTSDWRAFKKFSEYDIPIDDLSPIEKYELLFGNSGRPLMREMWDLGAWYQKEYGQVETWIGICHGWSYAAYSLPRPKHSVTMFAEGNGTAPIEVTFWRYFFFS